MALLFSAVTVTANDDKIEMLVSGIPKEYDEMEGWTDFDDFVNLLREESEVSDVYKRQADILSRETARCF